MNTMLQYIQAVKVLNPCGIVPVQRSSRESVPTVDQYSRSSAIRIGTMVISMPFSLIERSAGELGFSPLGWKGGEIHRRLARHRLFPLGWAEPYLRIVL